eukprot:Cvel_29921.t1-p1 / transcript=Cvel_29921.t1 / gene=Cvel_29921 / organism=Chromera_velia_CCMP2878 / gene_product=hypothetical protein / transcript_product=hypothetical protein / location=Cvel_scaffold4184:10659-11037(+) / protein_length=126 / sequence_SO=supercontig / SO=protein_coding / is_pseudo=false
MAVRIITDPEQPSWQVSIHRVLTRGGTGGQSGHQVKLMDGGAQLGGKELNRRVFKANRPSGVVIVGVGAGGGNEFLVFRQGFAEKAKQFVSEGGILVLQGGGDFDFRETFQKSWEVEMDRGGGGGG